MAINQKFYGGMVLKGDFYISGALRIRNSQYLMKLTTGGGSVALTPAGVTAGNVQKKIKIDIDGVDYYLLAASDWVNTGSESVSPSSSVSPSASASASVSPSSSASSSTSASVSPSASLSPSSSVSASPSA